MQKLESNLEYYKQKYEESIRVFERKSELEKSNENLLNKVSDFEKKQEFLESKISKYKEKICEEKNKIINFEVTLSKKNNELEILKQEKNEFELKINKLESELLEKSNLLDKNVETPKKELFQSLGAELSEFLIKSNFVSEKNKSIGNSAVQNELIEEELELLKKENILLIEKLKEISGEMERIKNDQEKANKSNGGVLERLKKENECLTSEIARVKNNGDGENNKELFLENKRMREVNLWMLSHLV